MHVPRILCQIRATEIARARILFEWALGIPSALQGCDGAQPPHYQKQLRLLRARQILVTRGKGVTTTAKDVGYESPIQFIREYARAFGLPPSQDTARMLANRHMQLAE